MLFHTKNKNFRFIGTLKSPKTILVFFDFQSTRGETVWAAEIFKFSLKFPVKIAATAFAQKSNSFCRFYEWLHLMPAGKNYA